MHRVFKCSNITLSKECVSIEDNSTLPLDDELTDSDLNDCILDDIEQGSDADDEDDHIKVLDSEENDDKGEPQLYHFPTIEEKEREALLTDTKEETRKQAPQKSEHHKAKQKQQVSVGSQEMFDDMVQKAVNEASRILEQAHDKAMHDYNEVIAKGEETVAAEREKARQDGFAEGMRSQIDNVRECIRKLEASIADIEGKQETFFMQNEADVKWLATEIAAKVMCQRTAADETAIIPLVKQAVASAKNAKWLTIEVSNEAEKLLDALYNDIAKSDPERIKIEPVEAPANTCRLTTPDGYIDASLYRQIENLKQYFELQ
ncbi:MAG: FliH/SctL family protein [Oscillospiraceae bacterium]